MRERKPVIGITCNFDYRDAVGMVSGMGITGQDWDFVSGDYVYILENAGAIPVLIPQYGNLEAAKPFLDQLSFFGHLWRQQGRDRNMNICIYGASSAELKKIYYEKTEELGRMMGKRGHGLVFGGGKEGLMGAAARGVDRENGYILGIAPRFFDPAGSSV